MEAVLQVTLGAAMAVCGIDIVKDGVTTTATIKSIAAAKDDYDDAISMGNMGALGERNADGSFSIRVGNLQPEGQVTTRVHIVAPVESHHGGKIGFAIPGALLHASGMRELELRVQTAVPGGADVGVVHGHEYTACPDGAYHLISSVPFATDGLFAIEVTPKKVSLSRSLKAVN